MADNLAGKAPQVSNLTPTLMSPNMLRVLDLLDHANDQALSLWFNSSVFHKLCSLTSDDMKLAQIESFLCHPRFRLICGRLRGYERYAVAALWEPVLIDSSRYWATALAAFRSSRGMTTPTINALQFRFRAYQVLHRLGAIPGPAASQVAPRISSQTVESAVEASQQMVDSGDRSGEISGPGENFRFALQQSQQIVDGDLSGTVSGSREIAENVEAESAPIQAPHEQPILPAQRARDQSSSTKTSMKAAWEALSEEERKALDIEWRRDNERIDRRVIAEQIERLGLTGHPDPQAEAARILAEKYPEYVGW